MSPALSRAFWDHLPDALRAGAAGPPPGLAQPLSAVHDAARAALPTLDLPPEGFAAHLARLVPADAAADLEGHLRRLKNAPDLYLACCCSQGLEAALRLFEDTYLSQVPGYLAHMNQSPSFAAEVQQLLRARLLVATEDKPPRIAEYAGRSSLASWLRTAATSTALNLLRSTRRELPMDEQVAQAITDSLDPERQYLKALYRAEVERSIRAAVAALPEEERRLLRLYFVGKLGLVAIGEMHKVHHTTVSRRLKAALEQLGEGMHQDLARRLGVDASGLQSLLALVRSQMQASVARLLAEPGTTGDP